MSDARQIANQIVKQHVFWSLRRDEIEAAITAALEAKERVLNMCKQDGQRWKEERDTYKAQLDEAVRLLRFIDTEGIDFAAIRAFLSTFKGPKP